MKGGFFNRVVPTVLHRYVDTPGFAFEGEQTYIAQFPPVIIN